MCSIKKLVKLTLIKTRMIDSKFQELRNTKTGQQFEIDLSRFLYLLQFHSSPLDHIYVHIIQTYTSVPGAHSHFAVDQSTWRCCCHWIAPWSLHLLDLPLVGTAGTIRLGHFCKLSTKPRTSTEVMVNVVSCSKEMLKGATLESHCFLKEQHGTGRQ